MLHLIKILLLPLILINFTLADLKPINIDPYDNKKVNSNLRKIVLFDANSKTGKQIATDLLKHKNYELHFTFSSEKALKSFSKYSKKQFSKNRGNNFLSYLYNPSYKSTNLPKSALLNSIVILPIGDNDFFVNPAEYGGYGKNILFFGFLLGPIIAKSESNKHAKNLNAMRYSMKDANWDIQKELLDKFKDAKHIILISSFAKSSDWFQQDTITRQEKSKLYFESLKIPYTIISTPVLTDKKSTFNFKDLYLRANNLAENNFNSTKTLTYKLKLATSDLSYFINECLNKLYIIKNKSFDLVKRKDLNLPELQQNNLEGLLYELQGKK